VTDDELMKKGLEFLSLMGIPEDAFAEFQKDQLALDALHIFHVLGRFAHVLGQSEGVSLDKAQCLSQKCADLLGGNNVGEVTLACAGLAMSSLHRIIDLAIEQAVKSAPSKQGEQPS
jgi:hypothetical protein